ncbi:hypothetical protein GCM10010988_23100 [Cnuibacter physcomitrellae]|nr:trypsin-like peptidase domain-containing protein [Cnuibacter physcomitrellae]GGI39244.1 hypothetical protein GCM10010988_23100 [Cnuibacter physcomitrellae]
MQQPTGADDQTPRDQTPTQPLADETAAATHGITPAHGADAPTAAPINETAPTNETIRMHHDGQGWTGPASSGPADPLRHGTITPAQSQTPAQAPGVGSHLVSGASGAGVPATPPAVPTAAADHAARLAAAQQQAAAQQWAAWQAHLARTRPASAPSPYWPAQAAGGLPGQSAPGGPAGPGGPQDPSAGYGLQPGQPPRRDRRAAMRRRRAVTLAVAGGLALAAIVGTSGYALGSTFGTSTTAAVDSRLGSGGASGSTSGGSGTGSGGSASGQGNSPYLLIPGQGSSGYGQYGSGGTSTDTSTDAVAASAAQKKGVVTIVSQLGYQSAESAGTGIILTSDGLILTNNHVVEGSTATQVTDETTGKTYKATVVGTDKTHDIAVLQLQDASGLTTASLEKSDSAAVGDAVTAVGNAGGTGDLVAAAGTVAAVDQTITTQSEAGVDGETLSGLIQVDADIVSGDSGGPLLDAQGDVVGIDTAASSGSADITGFAIPISTALDIAAQIEAGTETDTIEIGYPGFLGVELAQTPTGYGSAYGSATGRSGSGASAGSATSGATIGGVIEGTPADEAGLTAGDVITAVNGTPVSSADDLTKIVGQMEPGEVVTLTWTTASGTSQTAAVTLIQGPAA